MDATRYIDPTLNRPTVEFTVPGEPVSKSRHKTSVRKGQVRHYADPKNVQAQGRIGIYYRQSRGPGKPGAGGFGVEATFFVQSRQRRDVDNFLKLVFDGLTGYAWIDDSQVTEVSAKIIHGDDNPRSEIKVFPTDDLPDWLSKTCEHCGETFRVYASWSTRRYCSEPCRTAAVSLRRKRTCKTCGKEFRSAKAIKENPYCSVDCKTSAHQVQATCEHCGVTKMVARSRVRGRFFCDSVCQQNYWRPIRKIHAKGACQDCGGSTSKKSYKRCKACSIAARSAGVS